MESELGKVLETKQVLSEPRCALCAAAIGVEDREEALVLRQLTDAVGDGGAGDDAGDALVIAAGTVKEAGGWAGRTTIV